MDLENDQGFKDLVENIKGLADGFMQSIRFSIQHYTPEVEVIIKTKCRNEQQIERLLDKLLDLCSSDEALPLFKKLCRYYYSINPQVPVNYVDFYREMWDEEYNEKKELEENSPSDTIIS